LPRACRPKHARSPTMTTATAAIATIRSMSHGSRRWTGRSRVCPDRPLTEPVDIERPVDVRKTTVTRPRQLRTNSRTSV
jgi:hypothetical protein